MSKAKRKYRIRKYSFLYYVQKLMQAILIALIMTLVSIVPSPL